MSRIKSIDELVTSKRLRELNPEAFPHATAAHKAQAAVIAETLGVTAPVPNGGLATPNGKMSGSISEGIYGQFCARFGIPAPVEEYRFHPARRWRLDYAWPERMIGLEVEGGVWTEGRHTRGAGFLGDIEKYNAAAVLGWRILRTVPDDLMTYKTAAMLKEIFG